MKYTGDYVSKADDQPLKEMQDIQAVKQSFRDCFFFILMAFILESTIINEFHEQHWNLNKELAVLLIHCCNIVTDIIAFSSFFLTFYSESYIIFFRLGLACAVSLFWSLTLNWIVKAES